jgi:hypothetical protein
MQTISNQFRSSHKTAAVFAVFSLLVLSGCKGNNFEQISRILADPAAFSQKDVAVSGRVTRVLDPSAGLLNLAAYQIEDKSGRIWVISRSGAPTVGREVSLKARIRQDASLGGELFGSILSEVERNVR